MNHKKRIGPCPFCGKYAALKDDGSVGKYTIECVYCDARGSKLLNPHEVIAVWNRVASMPAELSRLRGILSRAQTHPIDWEAATPGNPLSRLDAADARGEEGT